MRKAEFLLDKLNIFPQILTPDLSSCNKNVYKLPLSINQYNYANTVKKMFFLCVFLHRSALTASKYRTLFKSNPKF